MFEIDTGAVQHFDALEAAAMDALPPDAARKDVLAEVARLIVLRLEKLKSPEAIRRAFWGNARLLSEMATAAPEAHDAVVAALFWGLADPDQIDRICDRANPMPPV